MRRFFIPATFACLFCGACYADTVYLNDNSEIKGIVVEEYVDRIVYSTVEGEREIGKADIVHIKRDEPADNLIALGDAAMEKGFHKVALKYYLMAQNVNPYITSLNGKIYRVETLIHKAPEMRKRQRLALKNEIMSGRPSSSPDEDDPAVALKKKLGIAIQERRGRFFIKDMSGESPFRKAGARKGDAIISVWSKLCDYMSLAELYELLASPGDAMINVTIERDLFMRAGAPFDASVVMEWEGAVVKSVPGGGGAEKAGFRARDLITAINGRPVRYVPLATVTRRLGEADVKKSVSVRRKLNIFKTD